MKQPSSSKAPAAPRSANPWSIASEAASMRSGKRRIIDLNSSGDDDGGDESEDSDAGDNPTDLPYARFGLHPSPLDPEDEDAGPLLESVEAEEERLASHMIVLSYEMGDYDAEDEEWLPPAAKKALDKRKKGPRKEHYHGPDLARKSKRSQRRHRADMVNQTRLGDFLILPPTPTSPDSSPSSSVPASASPSPVSSALPSRAPSPPIDLDQDDDRATSPVPALPDVLYGTSRSRSRPSLATSRAASSSHERSDHVTSALRKRLRSDVDAAASEEVPQPSQSDAEEEEMDTYLEITGCELRPQSEIRDWAVLRKQIEQDLARAKRDDLKMAQINQLLLLRNFATLRLKGYGRIAASQHMAVEWHQGEGVHFARQLRALARHYQLYEQLPPETRAGDRGHSLFADERVQCAARAYLSRLPSGEVTPKAFRRALNENILPSLGYHLKKPLSVRTARRWLVKLGWRRVKLRKGVYMDGHERPDVVEYRQEEFLPEVAKYERRMVQWHLGKDGKTLERREPTLKPGERRVIPIFQDESCFHAGEYRSNVWLRVGEQKLMKKSRVWRS
ncbi:hypothetical protein EV122DRAFT_255366 [Schizophyllum commune]